MDTNKMREQFEAWLESSTLQADLSKGNHGSYRSTTTHWLYCAWVSAWSRSREAVVVELPQKGDGYYPLSSWDPAAAKQEERDDVIDECREVIEAQGLKVAS